MKRRDFVSGVAALAASTVLPASAQQLARVYRVGALFGGGAANMTRYRAALMERLATHGFIEGRNLVIIARAGVEIYDADRNNVHDLLNMKVDALFTCLTRVTEAAIAETRSLPIVFAWVSDPVGARLVNSYARPGGNVTGVTNRSGELLIKRIELVRDLLPSAKRVAIIGAGYSRVYEALSLSEALQKAAAQLGLELITDVGAPGAWERTLDNASKQGLDAVVPITSFAAAGELLTAEQIIRYLNRRRLPSVFAETEMVEQGGLLSYGSNLIEDVKRGADLLAKVLKGSRPADLPVDQASRFELAVNLGTAKALGLVIPQSILVRADKVIK